MVGLDNEQSLHHFLSKSPWKVQELRQQRLEIILKILSGREIVLIIDDTGDKKQGHATDYVKRQYIGNARKDGKWNSSSYCLCIYRRNKFTVNV